MKVENLFEKATKKEILFYMTIAFIMSAIAIGFFIDFFISENSSRLIVAWIVGAIIALLIVYLFVGYIYHITKFLKATYKEKGNLFKYYLNDKNFRVPVNNAISCFYILATAFINFGLSFSSFKWYFLSSSAIFFLIFIMKLCLVLNVGANKKIQNQVITWLLMGMSFACAGVVVMLWYDQTGFSSQGLIIYWNALYVFVSFITAIVGIINTIKRKDRVIGTFLAVKLANAIFGMFSLTVSMLMTFSDGFEQMKLLALIVGAIAAALINGVAVAQLLLFREKEEKQSL